LSNINTDSNTDLYFTESLTFPKTHKIDFSKVETLEDVISVLSSLHIVVSEDYEHFDEIKPYLEDE